MIWRLEYASDGIFGLIKCSSVPVCGGGCRGWYVREIGGCGGGGGRVRCTGGYLFSSIVRAVQETPGNTVTWDASKLHIKPTTINIRL